MLRTEVAELRNIGSVQLHRRLDELPRWQQEADADIFEPMEQEAFPALGHNRGV
jgi:hypothetical protein